MGAGGFQIYACKCDVPKEKLKEDLQSCFEQLRLYQHENELTQTDVDSALECYSRDYYNFTIDDIELLTDIRIERNKRNGQKQVWHLEDIRSKKANMKNRGQAFKNPEGRPVGSDKRQFVFEWRQQHPDGKKIECERDTGLSRHTVLKWWDYDEHIEDKP